MGPRHSKKKKSGRRKKPPKKEEAEYWEIRAIIDERVVGGKTQYLVDWADDPDTGQSFPPDWSDEVTDEALNEWMEKKKCEKIRQNTQKSASPTAPDQPSNEEDQSQRPGNPQKRTWSNGRTVEESTPQGPDSEAPPRKKQKTKPAKPVTKDPVVLDNSVVSSPEPVRTQDLQNLRTQKVSVDLVQSPGFDPSEYQSVGNTQGIPGQFPELEQVEDSLALPSPSSQRTVPDSQDQSGSFSTQVAEELTTIPDSAESREQDPSAGANNSHVLLGSQGDSVGPVARIETSDQRQDTQDHQGISGPSQIDVVSDADVVGPEIPSRQPELWQAQTIDVSSPSTVPESYGEGRSGTEPVNALSPESSDPEESRSRPFVQPQPQNEIDLSVPQSSSQSQEVQRIPHDTVFTKSARDSYPSETTSGSQAPSEGPSQDLQAAQVVQPTFEPSPDKITDSRPTECNSQAVAETTSRPIKSIPISHLLNHEPAATDSPPQSSSGGFTYSRPTEHNSQTVPEATPQPANIIPNSHLLGNGQVGVDSPHPGPLSNLHSEEISKDPPGVPEQTSQISSPQTSILPREENMSAGTDDAPAIPQPATSTVDQLQQLVDFSNATHYPHEPDVDDRVTGTQDQLSTGLARDHSAMLVSSTNPPMSGHDVTIHQSEVRSQSLQQVDPWRPGVVSQSEGDPPQSISPASIMNNPSMSTADTLKRMIRNVFGDVDSVDSGGLDLMAEPEPELEPEPEPQHEPELEPEPEPELELEKPATVSPADISRPADAAEINHALLPLPGPSATSPRVEESSGESITMAQMSGDDGFQESLLPTQHEITPYVHFVTLPFQASRRDVYGKTLIEYKDFATKFGEFFSREIYQEPDEALEEKIDELFGHLSHICDYPPDLIATKLESLSLVDKVKYSRDANAKFSFLYELFQAIERDTEVLVVARSIEILKLLLALTEALGIECTCDAMGISEGKFQDTAVRATLALSTEEHDLFRYEVVIGFDSSFSNSPVSKRVSSNEPDRKPPLIMLLVMTHSIEHIDLYVPQGISLVERKNALLAGIVQARGLVADPDRGYDEPHQIAETFASFLNGYTESLVWEPQAIPDFVLDIYVNSQSLSQMPSDSKTRQSSRLKRKLDDAEDEEDTKRMRALPLRDSTTESKRPPLPDAVYELLKLASPDVSARRSSEAEVLIAIAKLESIAEKVTEYQRQVAAASGLEAEYKSTIEQLEKQVSDYSRSTSRTSETVRKALQDRSVFEEEKRKSDEAAKKATEARQKESDKAQKAISELQSTIERLTAAAAVGSAGGESPLAQSERLLKEARDKNEILEKRVANAHKDRDYVQNLYQEANTAYSALSAEVKELRARNTELEKLASDNMAQIHRIQANNAIKDYVRQTSDYQAQIKEREIELDRMREEIRLLKSGRRETRQASVPRSPRMGVMSPRPRFGGASGSASRGTSPAPALGSDGPFMGQQVGSSRWPHLRE